MSKTVKHQSPLKNLKSTRKSTEKVEALEKPQHSQKSTRSGAKALHLATLA